jgi:hypothetical protein
MSLMPNVMINVPLCNATYMYLSVIVLTRFLSCCFNYSIRCVQWQSSLVDIYILSYIFFVSVRHVLRPL